MPFGFFSLDAGLGALKIGDAVQLRIASSGERQWAVHVETPEQALVRVSKAGRAFVATELPVAPRPQHLVRQVEARPRVAPVRQPSLPDGTIGFTRRRSAAQLTAAEDP